MRFPVVLLAFGLLAAPVLARAASAPATDAVAPAAAPHHHRQSMQEHFDAANATHDGHLTREQAQAGYKTIARNFDAIDSDKKGYVTVDDIKNYRRAQRAARKAAREKHGQG